MISSSFIIIIIIIKTQGYDLDDLETKDKMDFLRQTYVFYERKDGPIQWDMRCFAFKMFTLYLN